MTARSMSNSDETADQPGSDQVRDELVEKALQFANDPDNADGLVDLSEALFRYYCARAAEGDAVRLLRGAETLSATETLMVASHLLRETNIEVFELALWQQWNREG